jgi:hypothetical protein
MNRYIFLSFLFVVLLCLLVVSVSAVSWETFSNDYYGGTPYEDATEDMLAEYALVEDMTDEEYAARFDSSESPSASDSLSSEKPALVAPALSSPAPSVSPASVQEFPSNNSAYSDPILIRTEYVPDAESGTLLSVLYGLFGKPVRAFHYSFQSGSNSYTQYKVVQQDYDAAWCSQVIIFILVLWCTLKIGGALICKNK